MNRFYFIFFGICAATFGLLYLSIWWLVAGVACGMGYIAYQWNATRLRSMQSKAEGLEEQISGLHEQLDYYIGKEERTAKESAKIKRLKNELLATMSHEVRTPMNGILGMAILMAGTPLNEEQREYIDTIRGCGESLLTTINNTLADDMVAFSKFEQVGAEPENKDFDLRNCLEEILDLFATRTTKSGLELLYSMDAQVPELIKGDSASLRQLLMNLIENAVTFTPKGEIVVSVRQLRTMEDNTIELAFEVSDTGIGIEAYMLERLFSGIPGKVILDREGKEIRGLGLVICRKLVEKMDGWIEAKSTTGEGSTFTFGIRTTISTTHARDNAPHSMKALEGRKVLIVDDNASSRAIMTKQLEQWKLKSLNTGTGAEALEILAQHTDIDLVITDLEMPEMDGIQLAQSIRVQSTSIPMILMASQDNERSKQGSGLFASVLTKPVKQYMLGNHLFSALSPSTKQNPDHDAEMSSFSTEFAGRFPLNILVAEDNPINQKVAIRMLAKLGYKPTIAANGKEVLEKVGNESFDIILMDVQMPEMNGLEATRMIRTCLEAQPVIIAMTANVMQGDRNDCMQAGMDDYLCKPVEWNEVRKQLEKWAGVIIERKRKIG